MEMHIPSAIPEIENEIAQELELRVLDINCCAQPPNVFCYIVAEYDASHRRFAGARLAHKQDLLLSGLELGGFHDERTITRYGRTRRLPLRGPGTHDSERVCVQVTLLPSSVSCSESRLGVNISSMNLNEILMLQKLFVGVTSEAALPCHLAGPSVRPQVCGGLSCP